MTDSPQQDPWEGLESWTVFRVPRSHYHCQLSNVDWSALTPSSIKSHVENFYTRVVDGESPHLILTGLPGICKSHIGLGMYRAISAHVGTGRATWVNVPAFCDAIKRGYSDGTDPWAEFGEARSLVVLDDLFGRDLSQHEASQIVYRLVDTAYTNGAALLVNMNQDINELPARLASHEISRLLAGATIIPMTSTKDWRR